MVHWYVKILLVLWWKKFSSFNCFNVYFSTFVHVLSCFTYIRSTSKQAHPRLWRCFKIYNLLKKNTWHAKRVKSNTHSWQVKNVKKSHILDVYKKSSIILLAAFYLSSKLALLWSLKTVNIPFLFLTHLKASSKPFTW